MVHISHDSWSISLTKISRSRYDTKFELLCENGWTLAILTRCPHSIECVYILSEYASLYQSRAKWAVILILLEHIGIEVFLKRHKLGLGEINIGQLPRFELLNPPPALPRQVDSKLRSTKTSSCSASIISLII